MNQGTLKKSAPLMCGALLATICVVAEPVAAEPVVFGVHTHTVNTAGVNTSSFTTTHTFGTGPQNIAGSFYQINITSSTSSRPNWQYEMVVDYSLYGISFFGNGTQVFDMLDIKAPGATDLITDFTVKTSTGQPWPTLLPDTGILGGGTGIHVNVPCPSILNAPGQIMIVQWNQAIPAPGALALLGLAGMVGGSRRRRAN